MAVNHQDMPGGHIFSSRLDCRVDHIHAFNITNWGKTLETHLYSWGCDQPSLQSRPQGGALTQPLPSQTPQSTAGYDHTAQSGTPRLQSATCGLPDHNTRETETERDRRKEGAVRCRLADQRCPWADFIFFFLISSHRNWFSSSFEGGFLPTLTTLHWHRWETWDPWGRWELNLQRKRIRVIASCSQHRYLFSAEFKLELPVTLLAFFFLASLISSDSNSTTTPPHWGASARRDIA